MQKQPAPPNHKNDSHKYNPQEDVESGSSIYPPRGAAHNGISHSGPLIHRGAFGSSWNKKVKDEEVQIAFGQEYGASGGYMQNSYAAMSNNHGENSTRPEKGWNRKYNQAEVVDTSEKQEWTHHLLDRTSSSHKKSDRMDRKKSTTVSGFLSPLLFSVESFCFYAWNQNLWNPILLSVASKL